MVIRSKGGKMQQIEQHQPFEKAAEINVGDVAWIKAFHGDPLDLSLIHI